MSTVAKTIALYPFARVIAAFAQFLGISIEKVHALSILGRFAVRIMPDSTGREPRRVELLDSLKLRSMQDSPPPVDWINFTTPIPSRHVNLLRDPTEDDPGGPDLPRLIANYALFTEATRYQLKTSLYVKSLTRQGMIKLVIQDGRISAPEGWATPTKVEYVTALCGGIAEVAALPSFEELRGSPHIDVDSLLKNGDVTRSPNGRVHGRLDWIDRIEIFPDGRVDSLWRSSEYVHTMDEVVLLCASLWAASVTQRNVKFEAQFNVATRTGGKTLHLRCLNGVITEQPTSAA